MLLSLQKTGLLVLSGNLQKHTSELRSNLHVKSKQVLEHWKSRRLRRIVDLCTLFLNGSSAGNLFSSGKSDDLSSAVNLSFSDSGLTTDGYSGTATEPFRNKYSLLPLIFLNRSVNLTFHWDSYPVLEKRLSVKPIKVLSPFGACKDSGAESFSIRQGFFF